MPGRVCCVAVDPGIANTGIVVVEADLEAVLKAPSQGILPLLTVLGAGLVRTKPEKGAGRKTDDRANRAMEIAKIIRKVAVGRLQTKKAGKKITRANITDYLGPEAVFPEAALRASRPGIATGLAWTEAGGDILFIEAAVHLRIKSGQAIISGLE